MADASNPDPARADPPPSSPASSEPDFGPSGYLPAKASARARKIVLRAPLGLQWVVGALLAGVVVVGAGIVFLTGSGPPDPPFVEAIAIEQVDGAVALADLDTLLVTGGGPAVAFAGLDGHDLAFCAETRRVQGTADSQPATWHPATGRGDGVASLSTHPVVVHDGVAYVDPSRRRPGPRPANDRVAVGCR